MTVRKPTTNTTAGEITILKLERGKITCNILGSTPLVYNAMNHHIRKELLMPAPKKNAAAKAATLKHEVITEFRNSVYRDLDNTAPTRLVMPGRNFKQSLCHAALDLPGSSRTQLGRLLWVNGEYISIYGIPKLFMAVVRNSDIKHTPDVRTRAILPHWACQLTIEYTKPILKEPAIVNLLAAAGIIQGVGDWRAEKGSAAYGQYELVGSDHPVFNQIVATGGRAAQDAAMVDPAPHDSETEQLLAWYIEETQRRGFSINR